MGADPVKGIIDPVVCQGLVKDPGFIMRMQEKAASTSLKKPSLIMAAFPAAFSSAGQAKIKDRAREFFLFHDIFQNRLGRTPHPRRL